MKASRFITLAAAAALALAGLQGCKKAPFENLDNTVARINASIEKGDSEINNPLFTVSSLGYDEATNTVKIELPAGFENVGADMVLYTVNRLAPELDEAVKAADANVMVVFNGTDGSKNEVLYENKEEVPAE